MLASNGEITAPYGVPTVPGVTCPSSITPAFSHSGVSAVTTRVDETPDADQSDHPPVADTMLDEADQPVVADRVEKPRDVGVQYPVHLAPVDPDRQRIQRVVLTAFRSEAIAEPQEIFLPDRVQHFDQRALDDLVLQRCYT
jgi:hypothetical protein